MFCNFYTKTVIHYGLTVYGTAAKTVLKRKSKHLREEFREHFIRKKIDSLAHILEGKNIFTNVEVYIIEKLYEISRQLRYEAPTQYKDSIDNNASQYSTRWKSKGLLP